MATTQRRLRVVDDPGPDDREIVEGIHRLRDTFLECRAIGHAWRLAYIGPITRADPELADRARRHPWHPDGARVLRCSRCRTQRVDLCLVGYGRGTYAYRLVSRYYAYPVDYAVPGAWDHRDWIHEEMFARNAPVPPAPPRTKRKAPIK